MLPNPHRTFGAEARPLDLPRVPEIGKKPPSSGITATNGVLAPAEDDHGDLKRKREADILPVPENGSKRSKPTDGSAAEPEGAVMVDDSGDGPIVLDD